MSTFYFVVTVVFFFLVVVTIFVFAGYLRRLRHKEILALAEKGLLRNERPNNKKFDSLRWGVIISGLGFALCIGLYPFGFISHSSRFPLRFGPWMIIGLIPLFFGLSLIAVYYLLKRENGLKHESNEASKGAFDVVSTSPVMELPDEDVATVDEEDLEEEDAEQVA